MALNRLDDSVWLSEGTLISDANDNQSSPVPVILDPLVNEYHQLLIGMLSTATSVDNLDIFRLRSRWLLYADIVGTVRSIHGREKLHIVVVDDGTGCISCTLWHSQADHTSLSYEDNQSADYQRVCAQLLRLADSRRTIPNRLRVGDVVHVRGRLKWFRDEVRLSANVCRILPGPIEIFDHLLHRHRLVNEVYLKSYDAAALAQELIASQMMNSADLAVGDACRIIKENALHLFTKLDLCLNSELVDSLNWLANAVPWEENDLVNNLFSEHSKNPTPKEVKLWVDRLIDRLLVGGWIFPASDRIVGNETFRAVHADKALSACVYRAAVAESTSGDGFSFEQLLNRLRQEYANLFSNLTAAALRRMLGILEADSKVYRTEGAYYNVA